MNIDKVRVLMAEELGIPVDDILPDSPLIELGDSLDIAALMIDLETELGIEIPDDDLQNICTVQNLVDYVNSRCVTQ